MFVGREIGIGTLSAPRNPYSADTGVFVVVNIHAVQDDIVLIAPRPHHFTAGRNTRLQAQQLNNVASIQRQLPDGMLSECISYLGVGGADGGGFRRYVHGLPRGSHFQLHVQRRRSVDLQDDMLLGGLRKARFGDRERILAGHYLKNLISARVVGNHLPRETGGRAAQRDNRAGNDGALRVRNHAMQRTGGLRVEQ